MSKTIDLEKMDHAELVAHRKEVDKALKTLDARRRKEALQAAKDAAAAHGLSLNDLMDGTKTKGTRGTKANKGVPKYQHPENSEMTWTGHGRKPKWVQEHLKAGKDIEELAI